MVAFQELAIVFAASIFSSYFGVLVGGSGLIMLPLLLVLGYPAPLALGSRRISATGISFPKVIKFHKAKRINYRVSAFLIPFAVLGSVIGFLIVDSVNDLILKKMIGILVIIFLLFSILSNSNKSSMRKGLLKKYGLVLGPALAVLATMVGITTGGSSGMVLILALVLVFGQSILTSSGTYEFILAVTYLVPTVLFAISGYIDYTLAAVMFGGNMLGSWFGSKFYLGLEEKKLKWVFFGVVLFLAIKTLL